MRARLVVFPIRGRNWCFSRSIEHSVSESVSAHQNEPSTLKELWKTISANSKSNPKPLNANAELVVDFVSNKMNRAWIGLQNAPEGTLKNKLHGLGLRLLSRVKPTEIFFKSISKDVTNVQLTYPSSLNPRLVRRRLRHIALRGTVIHKKYFYGSVTLLPLTSALTVLPLPNVPFFWVLFRTYSHWRALKGSEKLLQLVSDCQQTQNSTVPNVNGNETKHDDSENSTLSSLDSPWVLQPSKELEELIKRGDGDGKENENDGLNKCVVSEICKAFGLNVNDVLKYRKSLY